MPSVREILTGLGAWILREVVEPALNLRCTVFHEVGSRPDGMHCMACLCHTCGRRWHEFD